MGAGNLSGSALVYLYFLRICTAAVGNEAEFGAAHVLYQPRTTEIGGQGIGEEAGTQHSFSFCFSSCCHNAWLIISTLRGFIQDGRGHILFA